jgi:hypothetical protein
MYIVVQNLPARGRKTEKNKEMALSFKKDESASAISIMHAQVLRNVQIIIKCP